MEKKRRFPAGRVLPACILLALVAGSLFNIDGQMYSLSIGDHDYIDNMLVSDIREVKPMF